MSNAFDRSIKTAPKMFPLSTSFLNMSVKYVTASSVERLDRNPNHYSRGVTTTVSIDITGSIDIGL